MACSLHMCMLRMLACLKSSSLCIAFDFCCSIVISSSCDASPCICLYTICCCCVTFIFTFCYVVNSGLYWPLCEPHKLTVLNSFACFLCYTCVIIIGNMQFQLHVIRSIMQHKYSSTLTYQPDTKSNPNFNPTILNSTQ